MAKKVSKKSTAKTAKKAVAKKTVKKTAKKAAKKETKKDIKKTEKKTEPEKESSGKSAAKSAKASGTTVAQTPKTPKKKSSKKSSMPVSVVRGGLKLAPGVLITGNSKRKGISSSQNLLSEEKARKLTKKELSKIKDRLLEMRDKLLDSLRKEYADSRQRLSQISPDLVDQAADAYDEDISMEIAAATDEELEQIEAALEKIANNTYGSCDACNETISASRLKVLPFATRCVKCRGVYEKTKRRRENGSWAFVNEDGTSADDE